MGQGHRCLTALDQIKEYETRLPLLSPHPISPTPTAMPSAAKKLKGSLKIPKASRSSAGSSPTTPKTPKTPKTPADEGIDFFESAFKAGERPINVYELQLEPDGGPSKDRAVEYHLPVSCIDGLVIHTSLLHLLQNAYTRTSYLTPSRMHVPCSKVATTSMICSSVSIIVFIESACMHANRYLSICAFLQQTSHMFFAYRWKQEPRHRRTVCSKPTSHSTAVLLRGTASRNASTC